MSAHGDLVALLLQHRAGGVDHVQQQVGVGGLFEGGAEGTDDFIIYKVTDVTDDTVIVDGNHPFAGMTLNFTCTVTDVRPATVDEISHEHAHGAHGHHDH